MEKSGWSVKSVNHINDWSRIIVVYEKSNPTTTLVAYSSNPDLVKEVNKNTLSGWKIQSVTNSELTDNKTIVVYYKD